MCVLDQSKPREFSQHRVNEWNSSGQDPGYCLTLVAPEGIRPSRTIRYPTNEKVNARLDGCLRVEFAEALLQNDGAEFMVYDTVLILNASFLGHHTHRASSIWSPERLCPFDSQNRQTIQTGADSCDFGSVGSCGH